MANASPEGRRDTVTADTAHLDSDAREAFSCENLFVEYKSRNQTLRVLEDVSFSCRQGEFVGILGPSGTGKTTLLRILAGLMAPGAGSKVRFQGKEITEPPAGVGLVFQNYTASLLQWRTVERNVALGLEGTCGRAERARRVAEALELVGLTGRGRDYPWQLSGGMQQRVQIARTLVMRPQVLLMDEPFGALDAMTKTALQDQLLNVAEVTGATVVFVTHDIEEAVYLSDRVLVLSGTPARISFELGIDLPRPRDQVATKETPAYLKARHEVYEALKTGSGDK